MLFIFEQLGQTNLISGSTDFVSKFEGSVGRRKKRKIKKTIPSFLRFYAITNEIINKHIPLKKLSRKAVKQTAKPWISPAIQTSINIKNKYYKKFISTKHDFCFAKFKLYHNRLQFLIKLSKKSYYDYYFNKYSSDMKKMWSGIKQIITTKSKSLNHPLKISAQNKHEITDPQQIANSFNEYFVNIGQNLVTTIPPANNSPTDYLKNSLAHSFFLFPCTHNEIQLEIDKLTTGKATGPYSFPAAIIKILKLVIAKPLESIFNFSFQLGVVPSKFKVARVIPVFNPLSTELV